MRSSRTDPRLSTDAGALAASEAFKRRLQARDPEALERFFDAYFDRIYARVRSRIPSSQEAEDLTQDVFLRIHRSLPGLDPTRNLDPWVAAITSNRIRDHWRARRMLRDSDGDGEGLVHEADTEPPESRMQQAERDAELERAVYRLPLDMRAVLLLRVYDELDFKAIATLLSLTPAAARKRYWRALNRLRESLVPRLLEGGVA